MKFILLSILFTLSFHWVVNAQTPFISESLIKYNTSTHTTDKPIPFDKPFTLLLDKFKGPDVTEVHLYEAFMLHGNRFLVHNMPSTDEKDCNVDKDLSFAFGQIFGIESKAVHDISLKFSQDTSSLKIFVNPLMPNKLFDIHVISNLTPAQKALAYRLNGIIHKGDIENETEVFKKLKNALTDQELKTTYFFLNLDQYKTFYQNKLAADYQYFSDENKFPVKNFLTIEEIQAIDTSSKTEKHNFKDAKYWVEGILNKHGNDIQRGLIDISKVYQKEEKTELAFGHTRMQYLKSSLIYVDSLHQRLDWLIGKGYTNVTVNAIPINLVNLRTKISNLREQMVNNLNLLTKKMGEVSKDMDESEEFRQGTYIAGKTVSSDLKTAGGSLLFIDAGITNIFAPGLNNTTDHIPRLYTGVSIYFRPIDKNTRRNSFPKDFPDKNCYCQEVDKCGPDYGAITKASVWQHLCLNIGFTWGIIPNKDFENFYNGTSLLVGPGYRFARAFKISGGVAFLKRTSESPIISDKKVFVGQYISLSVDIDFIQSIKDVTTILLK